MIKNQRPYQLALYLTKSNALSLLIAYFARFVGRFLFLAASVSPIRKKVLVPCAKEKLQALYPKPANDFLPYPSLPDFSDDVDISVIVPAFNAEKYIEECLNSVLFQNSKFSYQLIVVNDNSTDRTAEILKKYENNPKVTVADLKDLGSAAKARNAGLIYATGKYIVFLDADDKLSGNGLDVLLGTALQTDADIVQGGWQYMYENGELGPAQKYESCTYVGKSKLDCFDLPGMPWGKIYKRELFEKTRFPANYTAFEDTIIQFLVFRNAKKIVSVEENVYYWRKNNKGITSRTQNNPKALQSYWIMEQLLYINSYFNYPDDDMYISSSVMQLTNYCYENVEGMTEEDKKLVFSACCELFKQYFGNCNLQSLPFAVRAGGKALKKQRYDLWKAQGKLFSLMK